MTSPKDAMPWVGLYIGGASLFCTLAMAVDAIQAIRQQKLWFPCKSFTINAASVTLIAIAMKLTMDLTTEMPGFYDKQAKYFGIYFLFTMLANSLPSLGLMGDKELLVNIIALGILIITVIVNMLIQSCTRVISLTSLDMIYLIFPVILPFSIALMVPTSKSIIQHRYAKLRELDSTLCKVNFSSKELRRNVKKCWMMATTGNPQFVIACSPICYALGVMCLRVAIKTLFVLVDLFKNTSLTVLWYGESDYKWSVLIILVIQLFGILVGSIAPIFRCFTAIEYFNVSIRWSVNHLNVFKVEKYWTQRLKQWRHIHVHSRIRGRHFKVVFHSFKNMVLNACIALQATFVVICKTICLVPKSLFIVLSWCCYLCTPLLERLKEEPNASNTNAKSEVEEYTSYVLRIEEDTKLSKWLLRNMLSSITRLLHELEKKDPTNLFKLLEKYKGYNGVLEFDNDQVPPLHAKENQNAWSLVVITLTSIALALPNIPNQIVNELLVGVGEGLEFVRHVEENLNANIEDLVKTRKASRRVWTTLESCCKWLRIDLRNDAYKGKTSREILQWLGDEAIKVVIQFKKSRIDSLDHSVHRFVSANSMYRISQTILLYCNDQENWPSDEEIFELVISMIADVLFACFTNLPRVITMKCHHTVVEQREDDLVTAAQLLGKSKKILKILKTRQLPDIDLDTMAYIDRWRVLSKNQILNAGVSSVLI
ncbi:uncharacterized protein LOC143561120 [Bidens hawaiensis]|uniref:uncharacterized protein LOC143561120 n=1 Tax=Bidens hawaiensis TaxID=980011 RepID=UPI004049EE3A